MPGPCVGRVGLGLLADCGSRLALRPDVDTSAEQRISAEKRSAVSTGQLSALLHLHTRPIDLLVLQEPTPCKGRRPHLAEGFTLRCLQRLSRPDLATQRCR